MIVETSFSLLTNYGNDHKEIHIIRLVENYIIHNCLQSDIP